ncbi:sensor histidine kinase [Thermoflavimicrobium daqui]|jgi:signal transduction histidine kinase|uniref:histidine kinase n=1 Tax=Thermoflavimicrobium daqui TaxID=2137476 RepID=A0A364K4U7_9BACL|nr:HAMP domain-containing sensor histidine kinase [Thermoflavimicrobium daqui]RAL24408.1 hypothetical protein DL897_08770 [Thermoflavimicrobium daqui]
MKLEARLSLRFLIGMIVILVIVIGVLFISAGLIQYFYMDQATKKESTSLSKQLDQDIKRIKSQTVLVGNTIHLTRGTANWLRKEEYTLQIINNQGKVIYSFQPLDQMSKHYTAGDLLTLREQSKKRGIYISIWSDQVSKNRLIWILAKHDKNHPAYLLHKLVEKVKWKGNQLTLPPNPLKDLVKQSGWLQVFDEEGKVIYRYQGPQAKWMNLSLGDLTHQLLYENLIYLEEKHGQQSYTWVLQPDKHKEIENSKNDPFHFVSAMFIACIVLIVLIYLFAKNLSRPIWFVMDWIQQLAKGHYQIPEPLTSGSGKKKNQIFHEVFQSLTFLSESLSDLEEERKRLEQAREEWLAGVSHDLKSPLSSIQGYADLYTSKKYQWTREEINEYLELVKQKTERVYQLIDDLNITFRLNNHALPLQQTPVNVAKLLESIVFDTMKNKGAHITLKSISSYTIMYLLDEQWFHRAIQNLIENAVVHNPPETNIEVNLMMIQGEGGALGFRITIRDDGKGISPDILSRLFERYVHGSKSRHSSGLGMSIAKQLIEIQGGRIEVRSEVGIGTEFEVTFQPVIEKVTNIETS